MTTKTKDEKQNGTVTAQQAREAIVLERRQRETLCLNEIDQVLQNHGCRLVPVAVFRNGQINQTVEIVAVD